MGFAKYTARNITAWEEQFSAFIENFLFSAYMIHTCKVHLWSVVPVFDHQRWRQIGDVIIANLTQIMTSGVNKSLTWTSAQIFSVKIASFCLKKKQARVGDWFWEIKSIEIGNNKTTDGVKIFLDKASRLSISIVIWILSSDTIASSTNSIQIVRRQCCLDFLTA